MKVAHVAPVFPPYRGGMGAVAYRQAGALAGAGLEVTVFTPRGAQPRERPAGVAVVELRPLARGGNAACLPQVLACTGGFDLVHLHYPFFGTAELLAARRRFGGPPLVLQYQMDVVGEGWRARLFAWHRRVMLPLVVRVADAIIVTSADYAAASFLASYVAVLGEKLAVLPAGVDLDEFRDDEERGAARCRLGLDDVPTVFFLARLDRAHYFKGLDVLIDAVARLPELVLVVGGDGECRAEHEARARAVLGERARFVGDIPEALLPAYYRAADVFVLPSVDRTEAFGVVLIEALACGTPVVASRLPGVRTLVEEGRTGYLAAPGDAADLAAALRRCLDESAGMGGNARAFAASRFGTAAVTAELIGLYRRVIAARARWR